VRVSSVAPRVVAHRGASFAEPEHTLAAYERAIAVGADALECDVRLSADGHLVCVHDRRVNRTSSGRGLVSTLELAQLEGLDWGAWRTLDAKQPGHTRAPEEPDVVTLSDRSHLLTLRRLLSMVADSGSHVEIAVETKHPTRYGGLVERTLAGLLDEFGWLGAPGRPGRVRMMSFSFLALRRMRQLAPHVPLVFLMERVSPPFRDGSLPKGVQAAGIDIGVLRAHPHYVERVHERGHSVHVWTVDDPVDVERCRTAEVEAIITNRPQEVLGQLRATRPG
jgi:glycerophosphoryl diester phosphodiesterase